MIGSGDSSPVPEWPGAPCARRLPGWLANNWWDAGDDGNRLAMTLCQRACPAAARARCTAPDRPPPVGVVCAGITYDDNGTPAPVCACGRPALVVQVRHGERMVAVRTDGEGAGSCTTCVPLPATEPFHVARQRWRPARTTKHSVDGGAVSRMMLSGWPTDRLPTIGEKTAAVAALLGDGLTAAEIADRLGWPGKNPKQALKRWITRNSAGIRQVRGPEPAMVRAS